MRYALEDLLRIRRIREDRAERAVEEKRERVRAAEGLLAQSVHRLEAFRQWRPQEEERLFRSIQDREVFLGDIDEVRLRIASLRGEEALREQAVEEARIKLREAQQLLEEAIVGYRKAVQARQKIEEHRHVWSAEAQRIAEAAAELELEDFSADLPSEA